MLVLDKQIVKAEEQIWKSNPKYLDIVESFMAPAHLARFLRQKCPDLSFPDCTFMQYFERSREVGKSLLDYRNIPGSVILYHGTE